MKKISYIIIILLTVFCINCLSVTNVYADSNSNDNLDFMKTTSYKYCGTDSESTALIVNIPSIVPRITSGAYNVVLVVVPLILVIMGVVDLTRGIMSQNEDEIKKSKNNFIKRLITGVIAFVIVLVVKFMINVLANRSKAKIIRCIDCFVSNECGTSQNIYNVRSSNSNSNKKS